MPKAILEFNLPEESEEFQIASHAGEYRYILSQMDNYLRSRIKYEELPQPIHDAMQAVRDKLWEFIKDENVEI